MQRNEIHGLGNLETSRLTHWFAHVVSTPFWEMGRGANSASTKLFWVPYETLHCFYLHLKISWKFEIIFWSLSRGDFGAFSKFPKMSKNASQLQWMLKLRCSNRLGWSLDLNCFSKKHDNFQVATRSDTAHFGTNSSEINLKEVKSLGSYDRYTFLFRKMCLGCQAFETSSATIFWHVFCTWHIVGIW